MTEFNLSEKRRLYLNSIRQYIRNQTTNDLIEMIFKKVEEQDKEFIRSLKEDEACWFCGSGYVRKDGRKEYKTGLCDTCHNLFNNKCWKKLRERRNWRIDKLAGEKLK